MGALILQGLTVADRSTVGAGAVVTTSINSAGIFIGIPAREMIEPS
jgi:acetyltransferase-like isoleucine patch superfamily enzyme